MKTILHWVSNRLGDTQLVMLLASLLVIFLLLFFFGGILAPLLVAIALAYVLDGLVRFFVRCRLPQFTAVLLVFSTFILLVFLTLLTVLPLLAQQVVNLISNLPDYMQSIRTSLQHLQNNYITSWLQPEQLQQLFQQNSTELQAWAGSMLKKSIGLIPGMIALLIYTVLVPVLVFFLLKDKKQIINWSMDLLPKERSLLKRVWSELDTQIGNYIRGRFWESVGIGLLMWSIFALMGHKYALLLGVLTGISVWIPFVGAAVVTIPVIFLSFFTWGLSDMTIFAILAYGAVQTFDANIVIPWLFSEIVDLHPIAIIIAVLVFGNMWGIIGVFIAIPMAVLVQSVLAIFLERQAEEAKS